MRHRILNYSISLLLLSLLTIPCFAQKTVTYNSREEAIQAQMANQQTVKKIKKDNGPKVITPFFNGLYVGLDLYGLGSNLLGSDFLSSEVNASVNLKNRYMPTVEIGYGKTDTWNENGIHYKTNAPYFRIGADYNFRWKKASYEDVLYFGLRAGYSNFKYDVENATINDPIYGESLGNLNLDDPIWPGSNTFNKKGMKGSMTWYELVGGIRTQIFKNIFMGWSIRLRYKLSNKMDESAQPWYVPGFGKYGAKSTGITYTIIYKFSLGAKKPTIITPVSQKETDSSGRPMIRQKNQLEKSK